MQKKLNIQSDTHADAPPKFFDEPPAWADEREPIIPVGGIPSNPTVRSVGEVKQVVTERITRAELKRRQQQDQQHTTGTEQSTRDINDVMGSLSGILPDLHRRSDGLHAACPKCSHDRNPNKRDKSDRFFCTAKTNYSVWWCRHCEYTTYTNRLLGIAPGAIATQRATVNTWTTPDHSPQQIEWSRAAYASLAEFAHRHLNQGMNYLKSRGVSAKVAHQQMLGFINAPLYLEWYRGLTPELKAGVEFGGLPEPKECGTKLGAGWAMVSGYQGKIVYPYLDHDGVVCDIRTRSISDRDTSYSKQVRYIGPRGGYTERQAQLPYTPRDSRYSSVIILTEGEFKSLVPLSKGCIYPVFGLRGSSEPVGKMIEYFHNKTVILAFDNDEAGQLANVKQARALRADGVSVLIFNPAQLAPHKAIDDFINAEGIEIFNKMLAPGHSDFIMTLEEYEATIDSETLDRLKKPSANVRTNRQWMPAKYIDKFAHPEVNNAIPVDEASDAIYTRVTKALNDDETLLVSAPTGVGKSHQAFKASLDYASNQSGIPDERQAMLDNDQSYQASLIAYETDMERCRAEGIARGDERYLYLSSQDSLDPKEKEESAELENGSYGRYIGAVKRGEVHQVYLKAFEAERDRMTAELDQALPIIEGDDIQIVALLPNHEMIKEKTAEGDMLEGFQHIEGRNVNNCKSHIVAKQLTAKGYRVNDILCGKPLKEGEEGEGIKCPFYSWCCREGYKSQFKESGNQAMTHAHLFTDKASSADIIVVDEANHKSFINTTDVTTGDLWRVLDQTEKRTSQLGLVESLIAVLKQTEADPLAPGELPKPISLDHVEFYEVLQRHFPEFLDTVDDWAIAGDTSALLNKLADESVINSPDGTAMTLGEIPPFYSVELFKVLADDARRIHAGQQPSGNLKVKDGEIQIVSRRDLPDLYEDTKIILLNATADVDTLSDVFGRKIDVFSPNVAIASGNTIIQDISRNNAKSGLLGNGETVVKQRELWIDSIKGHMGTHDESDVVLVTVKALAPYLTDAFPLARVAWYGALEGRNDLQAGLTILCNPPAINLPAIQDEARALWPGIDVSLVRKSIAFNDIQNDREQYLAIEQMDAVDPRLSALIDQHRDALTVQAIGRARLVRYSGRRVVVMFSRPIPGVIPTETIHTKAQKHEYKENKTLEKLITTAAGMLQTHNSFSISTLAAAAGSVRRTVKKYWNEIVKTLNVEQIELPCIQSSGVGNQSVKLWLAMNAEGKTILRNAISQCKITGRSIHYYISNIVDGSTSDLAIPEYLELDIKISVPERSEEIIKNSDQPAENVSNDVPAGHYRTGPTEPILQEVATEPPIAVQVARRVFPTSDEAQAFADRLNTIAVYSATVNGYTVDRRHLSGFDINHLSDEFTEIIEVTK